MVVGSWRAAYAHLDDRALRDAAAQASSVIAGAMGYKAVPPRLPDMPEHGPAGMQSGKPPGGAARPEPVPAPDTPGDAASGGESEQHPFEPARSSRKVPAPKRSVAEWRGLID